MAGKDLSSININEPKYDQSTYIGRAKHFFTITNPLNLLASSTDLERAKAVVKQHREGFDDPNLTEIELWRAKELYDSAYHPDTGEKMTLVGRMSAQVPMNMTITGCMLTFYKSNTAVIFWQWVNQTFNAIVNYTNRSGDSPISVNTLGVSYVAATTGAVTTALLLNRQAKRFSPLIGRFVPFVAVCAANCVNIPFMRNREIANGIPVFNKEEERVGNSKLAAKLAITQVLISRIVMAAPGMMITPVIMDSLEKGAFLKRFPFASAPVQVSLVGIILVLATPLCCALFPQKSFLSADKLESELGAKLKNGEKVHYNKGL